MHKLYLIKKYIKKGQLIVSQKNVDSEWLHGFYFNDINKQGIFPRVCVAKVYLRSSSTPTLHLDNIEETNPLKDNDYANEATYPAYAYETNATHRDNSYSKQARVLYAFSRDSSDNSQMKYLNLDAGDYVLVIGNFDDNWLICENFKNEKGIFPANYVEYIEG